MNGKECLILDIGHEEKTENKKVEIKTEDGTESGKLTKREITYVEYDDDKNELQTIDLLDFVRIAEFIKPYEHLELERKKIAEVIDGVFEDTDNENEIKINNFGLAMLFGVMISRGVHVPIDIFVKIVNLPEYQNLPKNLSEKN